MRALVEKEYQRFVRAEGLRKLAENLRQHEGWKLRNPEDVRFVIAESGQYIYLGEIVGPGEETRQIETLQAHIEVSQLHRLWRRAWRYAFFNTTAVTEHVFPFAIAAAPVVYQAWLIARS